MCKCTSVSHFLELYFFMYANLILSYFDFWLSVCIHCKCQNRLPSVLLSWEVFDVSWSLFQLLQHNTLLIYLLLGYFSKCDLVSLRVHFVSQPAYFFVAGVRLASKSFQKILLWEDWGEVTMWYASFSFWIISAMGFISSNSTWQMFAIILFKTSLSSPWWF